jgi:L-seryl-tRNA(Ser) seleniumtransferase
VERLAAGVDGGSQRAAVRAARLAIAEERERIRAGQAPAGADELLARAREHLRRPPLGPVINATGVIVHTNLGRAPLAAAAREAVARVARGYSDLELDPQTGGRGSRQRHVRELLRELTGAQDAIAVNNCAAATLLACAALAGDGRAVIVSRGQLVEIGGSFRIPEVLAVSGARMVEVGTTNRTRRRDYERALAAEERPGAILRVHQSNFRTVGFTEEVAIGELCALGVPVIDDVGSGALEAGLPQLAGEPAVRDSIAAGAALVCFSGDKLLGGPQAGVIAGSADAVAAAAAHPLARAVRIDKLCLAALQATLELHRDPERALAEIPVLAMLAAPEETLRARAERLADALAQRGVAAEIVRATARVGGGALPLRELPGPAVVPDAGPGGVDALADALRAAPTPVLGRINEGRLLLDPRTLTDDDVDLVAAAVAQARGVPD